TAADEAAARAEVFRSPHAFRVGGFPALAPVVAGAGVTAVGVTQRVARGLDGLPTLAEHDARGIEAGNLGLPAATSQLGVVARGRVVGGGGMLRLQRDGARWKELARRELGSSSIGDRRIAIRRRRGGSGSKWSSVRRRATR